MEFWRIGIGLGLGLLTGCQVSPFGVDETVSLIVGFGPEADRDAVVASVGGQVTDRLAGLNAWVVQVPARTASGAQVFLQGRPGVRYAERNGVHLGQATGIPGYQLLASIFPVSGRLPADPHLNVQWGLDRVQAPAAWAVSRSEPEVLIAILDSGIDQEHPDLAPKIVAQENFSTSPTLDDRLGHGTHVAGIAAAVTDNGVGVAGAGYHARLLNGKVISDFGTTEFTGSARGIQWAADQGAKVINMSYGSAMKSEVERDAIAYAAAKGVVLVSIAGNKGTSAPSYPGAYPEVIAVGATTAEDQRSAVSGYGADWVDVAAPGENIYSTLPTHLNKKGSLGYGALSGSSMSAAFVSGEAALVWPTAKDAKEVRRRIEASSDRVLGTGTMWAHGRVNFRRAVEPTKARK